jgi:hypothetical protein
MCLAAVAVVFAAAGPLRAATVGGEVFGAFNSYTMEDFNSGIQELNSDFGTNYEEINNGFTGGLGIRIWPAPSWMISAGWEPLFAESKSDVTIDRKVNADANAFQLTGAYFFPSQGPGKFGMGAGVGYYTISGEAEEPDGLGGTITSDVGGSTIGFHFLGLTEWTASPGFAVTGAVGYRVANVEDTEFDGQSTVPKSETDYSGLMLRAGLAFYLPSSK